MEILCFFLFLLFSTTNSGILYPRPSETRELLPLNGLWDFTVVNNNNRFQEWHTIDFKSINLTENQFMPVPASYNDLSTSALIRDHCGLVQYQRKFFIPKSWKGQNVFIRFGSVCRAAEVWINEKWVASHDIGHLPFQADITEVVDYGKENVITVSVDNILTQVTVPQGSVKTLTSGRLKQTYTFDFFNYAGIDRPVVLYTTPSTYIDDVNIATDIDGTNGFVNYSIITQGTDQFTAKVTLLDKIGETVVTDTVLDGSLFIPNATFWWPYLMNPNPGYLYSLKIEIFDTSGNLLDQYSQPVGIRTISWDSTSVKINNVPIYLRGFGRHEDSDIRGKGLDLPLIIRDYNLIKWIGANAYRTSHYPYAEEIMDLADELGIMIIDESPAVNTENYSPELLENHKQSLTELIQRDKNRPSVIMWSAANEPRTQYTEAENYYKEVVNHIKSLDKTRPVTVVNNQLPDDEYSGQFIDVASCNVYNAWYSDPGDVDVIFSEVGTVVRRWHELHNIPVIVSEYGADTLEGMHSLPAFLWSEEYQNLFLSKYFEIFDQLREEGFFIGEMVWNFADFKTDQEYHRAGGNKKGVFTRNRQPKASAHLLRKRYWKLAQYLDKVEVPDDLEDYTFQSNNK